MFKVIKIFITHCNDSTRFRMARNTLFDDENIVITALFNLGLLLDDEEEECEAKESEEIECEAKESEEIEGEAKESEEIEGEGKESEEIEGEGKESEEVEGEGKESEEVEGEGKESEETEIIKGEFYKLYIKVGTVVTQNWAIKAKQPSWRLAFEFSSFFYDCVRWLITPGAEVRVAMDANLGVPGGDEISDYFKEVVYNLNPSVVTAFTANTICQKAANEWLRENYPESTFEVTGDIRNACYGLNGVEGSCKTLTRGQSSLSSMYTSTDPAARGGSPADPRLGSIGTSVPQEDDPLSILSPHAGWKLTPVHSSGGGVPRGTSPGISTPVQFSGCGALPNFNVNVARVVAAAPAPVRVTSALARAGVFATSQPPVSSPLAPKGVSSIR